MKKKTIKSIHTRCTWARRRWRWLQASWAGRSTACAGPPTTGTPSASGASAHGNSIHVITRRSMVKDQFVKELILKRKKVADKGQMFVWWWVRAFVPKSWILHVFQNLWNTPPLISCFLLPRKIRMVFWKSCVLFGAYLFIYSRTDKQIEQQLAGHIARITIGQKSFWMVNRRFGKGCR